MHQTTIDEALKELSFSAQLRHLKKPKFGGHTVNRRREKTGGYSYQIVPNISRAQT